MSALRAVKTCAAKVVALQSRVTLAEADLLRIVQQHLEENRGGVREIARKMGFSPQYICDVQHGRRKISAEFVERLGRL